MFSICVISEKLPDQINLLLEESQTEGFNSVFRLLNEWQSDVNRFSKPGEKLLAAFQNNEIAAIGGITIDPDWPVAFRMRRFYVRKKFRKTGLGTLLAQELICTIQDQHTPITINVGTKESFAFWEKIGFTNETLDGHTHVHYRA